MCGIKHTNQITVMETHKMKKLTFAALAALSLSIVGANTVIVKTSAQTDQYLQQRDVHSREIGKQHQAQQVDNKVQPNLAISSIESNK